MKIKYINKNFAGSSLTIIEEANKIIAEYIEQGFKLNLRQLYYQFVSRDLIQNKKSEYKRLGSIINDARLAGFIDWESIEDRTRGLQELPHWYKPSQIIDNCVQQYKIDKWDNQRYRLECFPGNTIILTNKGPVPISEIKIGDKVLTDKGTYEKVEKIFAQPYKGNLSISITRGLPPIKSTPTHPILSTIANTKLKYKGKNRKYFQKDFSRMIDLKKFDLVHVPIITKIKDVNSIIIKGVPQSKPIKIILDELLCSLIGVYIAKGRIREDKKTIQFTLNKNKLNLFKVIKKWASAHSKDVHDVIDKNTRQVNVYSKSLCTWIENNFNSDSYKKTIPEWFMYLPFNKQIKTIKYYILGNDNTKENKRSALRTTSRSISLSYQIYQILLRLGHVSSLKIVLDYGKPRYDIRISGKSGELLSQKIGVKLRPKKRRFNHFRINKEHASYPIISIKSEKYNGIVYNLEVSKRHVYCVPFIVHNCWVEKDALTGVIENICNQHDVPYFSCRGYSSQSEMWKAGQRFIRHSTKFKGVSQIPVIIHLGDHDPSGIDMTRDIKDRLGLFMGGMEIKRIALNIDQIERYKPPPNPAKTTDSRYQSYIVKFGEESWELDALEPKVLVNLIDQTILSFKDPYLWKEKVTEEQEHINILKKIAENLE